MRWFDREWLLPTKKVAFMLYGRVCYISEWSGWINWWWYYLLHIKCQFWFINSFPCNCVKRKPLRQQILSLVAGLYACTIRGWPFPSFKLTFPSIVKAGFVPSSSYCSSQMTFLAKLAGMFLQDDIVRSDVVLSFWCILTLFSFCGLLTLLGMWLAWAYQFYLRQKKLLITPHWCLNFILIRLFLRMTLTTVSDYQIL